jgi:2'-5' RNA ligase
MTNNVEEFLATQGIKHAQADGTPNTSVCIVALPRATDPIRLVGDVDKHATLLFFGDMATLPDDAKTTMTETLQNVMQLFSPFGEQILDIGRLGSDNPPALVAMLSGSNLSRIRDALLINPKLGEYLQNNPNQYPNYTPHVTLAYPDYQEEAALRQTMKQLYKVRFDRLSLWWGDEQIDFSLETMDEMAQAEKLEAFLAHHGVKGMKWGVRRSDATLDSAAGRPKDTTPKGTDVKSRIAMKLASPGSVIARGDGKVYIKKKDGSWGETHLSSEAENLVKTRQTRAHELSNKELQDALARARLIEDYNKFFNDPNGREMKMTVERLQTQKSYNQLHSELHPSARKQAVKFVAGAGTAYIAFKKIDNASDGALSKGLVKAFTKTAAKEVVKGAAKGAAKAAV